MEGTESIGSASGYFNIATVIDDKMAKASLFNKGRFWWCLKHSNVYLALECWNELIFQTDTLEKLSDADKYQALMTLTDLQSYFKEQSKTEESALLAGILSKFANSFNLPGSHELKTQFEIILNGTEVNTEVLQKLV